MKKNQIYLAAPLFSFAEQKFNLILSEYLLVKGYKVFLPQKECENLQGEDIYKTCLRGLETASIVVAVLDGADADSGTCWECGYACARNIPIIAVRTDIRHSGDTGGFNAMLYYSASVIIENTRSFLEEIAMAASTLENK